MSRIGFDFGTTNSIISFHDPETGTLSCFRTNACGTDYIPTVISYGTHRGKERVEIGNAAKLLGDGNPNVYGRFKLRLGSRFDEKIPGKEKTAHEAAKDYIRLLLEQFKESGHDVESMVMTIPEAWYREQSNYTARENIQSLLMEIGLTSNEFRFQSEPVAAAAYFCWQWQKLRNQNPYDGRLLVVDYGGGTLDVTLCQITNGNRIRTLDNYGSGEEGEGIENGHAGSAFLSRVIRIICEENGLTPTEKTLSLAHNELEAFLIDQERFITETMNDYLIAPDDIEDEDQHLFDLTRLNDTPVKCEHLQKAFNEVNEKVLEDALEQIIHSDDYDPEHIKVILVGGFSNFCCVENKVRAKFNSRPDAEDPRFPDSLSEENRALAIAKGAALIADGSVTVDPVFPYEVGIVVGAPDKDNPEIYHEVSVPLIQKNDKIDEYNHPVFSKERVRVFSDEQLFIRMYRTIGKSKDIFRLNNREDLSRIFPLSDRVQVFEIGLSVDEDMIPTLYTRDEEGNVLSASLNKILERISITKV